MEHTESASSLPPDKIFIGRIQEMELFRKLLSQWQSDLSSGNSEALNGPPSPHQRIPGFAVFLFGQGGIGKTTLLQRFHQMALAQLPRYTIPAHPINWEFVIGDEHRRLFNLPPGSHLDPLLYFDLLRERLRSSLGREDDFKEYKTTVQKVRKAREQAQQVFASLKQDEQFSSWLPKLISEGMATGLGALFPPAGPFLRSDAVKEGISQGLAFTESQLTQLWTKLRDKLDQNLTYHLEPDVHLGLALGRDLAGFAKSKPILFFFDTYEEIDEGDLYLRIV
ncbi:MAG: hypothetical protein JO125_09280, partial [Chloroflexi bacterium]|nr:hypothetical protein [Chloroflexota bacterium]